MVKLFSITLGLVAMVACIGVSERKLASVYPVLSGYSVYTSASRAGFGSPNRTRGSWTATSTDGITYVGVTTWMAGSENSKRRLRSTWTTTSIKGSGSAYIDVESKIGYTKRSFVNVLTMVGTDAVTNDWLGIDRTVYDPHRESTSTSREVSQ